jgi:hypothetical protein
LNQINVVGSPEVDRQVQGMQEQLVHLFVDVQETKAQFRAEANAQCEGRAQDRQIYLEAFMIAERFYEQKAHRFAEECEGFLRGEVQEFSRRQAQEEATFRRLREHKVQRAHEYEMRAKAAINQEASWLKKRCFNGTVSVRQLLPRFDG